jgi:hypothetical protein
VKEYLETFEKTDIPKRLRALNGKRFSDVEDADGFQYVDLVQEGGVLGICPGGLHMFWKQPAFDFLVSQEHL